MLAASDIEGLPFALSPPLCSNFHELPGIIGFLQVMFAVTRGVIVEQVYMYFIRNMYHIITPQITYSPIFHLTGRSNLFIVCPLSHVINLSLIQGIVPDDLKSAGVVPLFVRRMTKPRLEIIAPYQS